MSSLPKIVQAVNQVLTVSPTQKVLVLEGPSDREVYERWLKKLAFPNPYTATLKLVDAGGSGGGGGKIQVLQCLRWFAANGGEPRVFGLVDRDEWDTATLTSACANLPQLRVNPERHALESYFCDPQEIWQGLLALNPAWAPEQANFQAAVDAARLDYLGHWALLSITDRIKVRMGEQGFPGQFSAAVPIPADSDIQARFALWSNTLDPLVAFHEFDSLRNLALSAQPNTQFRSHVWAKLFFDQVIQPLLNAPPTINQQTTPDWMVDLAEFSPSVPADLAAILHPLL